MVGVQIHSFEYEYPVVPVPFDERLIIFFLWDDLGTLVKNKLSINVQTYFWTLFSQLLTYMSI